jgi:hypothetical protein
VFKRVYGDFNSPGDGSGATYSDVIAAGFADAAFEELPRSYARCRHRSPQCDKLPRERWLETMRTGPGSTRPAGEPVEWVRYVFTANVIPP